MPISKSNVAVNRNNGRVGNIRYYTKAGNTYTRTVSAEVNNPRTLSQMAVRCRLANIKNVYQAMSGYLAKCFEGANSAVSIYNLFTGRNHFISPVYLTKEQKLEGYAIANGFCVSMGSLPPIKYEMDDTGVLKSSIAVGNAAIESMNIGQLSSAIIDGNINFMEGDSLTFFALKQVDFMGTPYVKLEPTQIVLKRSDINPIPAGNGFHMVADGMLAADCSEQVGAYGWIHARKDGKKVSTQYLVLNDFDLLDIYSSDAQLQLAAESYGETQPDAYIFGGQSSRPEGMYLLTVNSEDAAKGSVTGGGYYAEGDSATFSAYPKSGYQFAGWYRGAEKFSDDATCSDFDMPATDVTVVAHFSAIPPAEQVTISLTAGTGGQVKAGDSAQGATSSKTIAKGDSISIQAIPSSGYSFVKWSDNDTNRVRALANVQSDLNLSAEFEENTGGPYNVTITKTKVGTGPVSAANLVLKIDGTEVAAGAESGSTTVTAGSHTISIEAVAGATASQSLEILIDGDMKAQGEANVGVTYSHNASADFALDASFVGGF